LRVSLSVVLSSFPSGENPLLGRCHVQLVGDARPMPLSVTRVAAWYQVIVASTDDIV
jgi:hypothetical protein